MDSLHSANRFMAAFFLSALIEAVAVVCAIYAFSFVPFLAALSVTTQLSAFTAIVFVVLNGWPLAKKFRRKTERERLFTSDDGGGLILGRTFGIVWGLITGTWLWTNILT